MNSSEPNVRGIGTRSKVTAAAVGAGVVITMGALTVAISSTEAHATSPNIGGAGNTSTQTTPPSTPRMSMARPSITTDPSWAKCGGKG
ncbi:MAG: hypothetical protein QOE52_5750 [Mycobacterium sp.]|nr:hypothetical protein [Mycobacterium sp.]